MSANAELIEYIYKNAGMGVQSIGKLIEKTQRDDFKSFLSEQYADYKSITEECERIAREDGIRLKELGVISKLESDMMIKMKTVADASPDTVAEMLMKDSVMGIVQSIRRIKEYEKENTDGILDLARKLLAIEQRNIQECPKWLGVK